MRQAKQRYLWITEVLLISGIFVAPASVSLAQITPDNTLRDERSRINRNVNIREGSGDRIDGGALRGANLFHSFAEFNVNEGQRVYFSNPAGVDNILSRVTGSDASDILGTLGVDGAANLFFLNPNGIIFGANARLDVSGSFVASTADRFTFSDGSEFSAVNPQAAPLLTVSVPIGLQYGPNAARTIQSRGQLQAGQDLILAADILDLQGQLQAGRNLLLQAQDTVLIRDSVEQPFRAIAGGQLQIQGNQTIDIFALNHPDSGLFSAGDMVLRSANAVGGDAHYWSNGNFRIEQLEGNLGRLFSPDDPVIRASGDVSFDSYAGASLHIFAGGSVMIPGGIFITGTDTTDFINELVQLSDGSEVLIDGSARPTVDIRAGILNIGTPNLPGDTSGFFPDPPDLGVTPTSADITIGDIFNDSGDVLLTNQYQPNPALTGNITVNSIFAISEFDNAGFVVIDSRGDITSFDILTLSNFEGGDITLLADGQINLIGFFNSINTSGDSRSGDIRLIGNNGIFIENFEISAAGFSGLGSNITLESQGHISVVDATIRNDSVDVTPTATRAGDIVFRSRSFSALRTLIQSTTFGSGDAGSVILSANDLDGSRDIDNSISLDDTRISVESLGTGDPGNLSIRAGTVQVLNSSELNSLTDISGSAGDSAGDIDINATVSISFSDSIALALVNNFATGDGGNITMTTAPGGSFSLIRSSLTAETRGAGDAGDITLTAGAIFLESGSIRSNVFSTATGDGGTITINGTSLSLNDLSELNASTDGQGAGGDIRVTAIGQTILSNARMSAATSTASRAGNIRVATGSLTLQDEAQISVLTQNAGQAGNVILIAPSINLETGSTVSASATATATVSARGGSILVDSDRLTLSGTSSAGIPSTIVAETEGAAAAGTIRLRPDRRSSLAISLADNAQISAATSGSGRGGDLTITAPEAVTIRGAGEILVETSLSGEGGNIRIDAPRITITDGVQVSATATATASARGGNIVVTGDRLTLSGARTAILAESQGGTAGSLTIDIDRLRIIDGATATVSSTLDGDAGSLTVIAEEVLLDQGTIAATTEQGESGNVLLRGLNALFLSGNSAISASTQSGQAGSVSVEALDRISLTGNSRIESAALAGGTGGDVQLNTGLLEVRDRSSVSVSSTLDGASGNLTIEAREVRLDDQASITAETQRGRGGNVTLLGADFLSLEGRSSISASTRQGQAGNLSILMAPDGEIELSGGSRIAAEVTRPLIRSSVSIPTAGNLTIRSDRLTVRENSEITVSAPGGQAGSLRIRTRDLLLDNGFLQAETGFSPRNGQGANIELDDLDRLLMQNGSLISARALGDADGGNVTIDAGNGFIVATPFENNDMIATAERGTGGNINVRAIRLFGFSDLTAERLSFEQLRNNETSDISASSEFGAQGVITFEILNVDPSQGLTELPDGVVDASQQIAPQCRASGITEEELGEFIITGRGGLPPSPDDLQGDSLSPTDLISLGSEPSQPATAFSIETTPTDAVSIVEAQGWTVSANGEVMLTAASATPTPHAAIAPPVTCVAGE